MVVLAAAAVGLAAFQSGPAHAAAVTGLPITSVYQVVADTAHGHLFISQGPDAGTDAPVVVTNLSGAPITTIGDWVGYQDASTSLSEVGGIDLADPSAPWASVPGEWFQFPPAIAADPSDTGILVASGVGTDGTSTATYNVSDPSAVTLIASSKSIGCGNNGLSVFSGGKTFLCGGFPYSTATLAPNSSGTYLPGYSAVAPNGAMAVGDTQEIFTYPAGGTAPTENYDQFYGLSLPASFTNYSSSPVDFAWAADSRQLFAVIESASDINNNDIVYTLLSLYPFERVPTDLTLTSTATTIAYRGSFTVTAHLGFTDSSGAYSVYQTIAGQPRRLDWSCPCGLTGSFTTGGSSWTTNETLTAVFTGNALYEPATVTLAIKVGVKVSAALSGYYKIDKISGLEYRVYHHAATLKDLVTVVPNKAGECVRLQVQQARGSVWRADATTSCAALNKWSQAMMARKLGPTGWFRVRADFTPSAKDIANVSTAGSWLYYEVTR